MADSSGPRVARSRRESVEARLVDLFADGLPPRLPGEIASGIGGTRGWRNGAGERERWRDEQVAERDPHDDFGHHSPRDTRRYLDDAGDPDDARDHFPDDARGHYPDDDAVGEADPFSFGAKATPTSGRSGSVRAPKVDPGRGLLTRLKPVGGWVQRGRWRIDPDRRGALAVLAAILVAAVAVGWQALASRPHAESVADTTGTTASFVSANATPRASSTAAGSAVTATTSAAKVIVDVVGRVHRPGLVTLPAGSRVADAVRAAGGALAGTNLTSINLARVCVDGEQIAVGVTGAVAPGGPGTAAGTAPGSSPASGAPGGLVNLNTATADQLDALPGVGPVMAQRIIAYRTDHGPFTAVTQLQQVSGIGDAKYADLRPLVTV